MIRTGRPTTTTGERTLAETLFELCHCTRISEVSDFGSSGGILQVLVVDPIYAYV